MGRLIRGVMLLAFVATAPLAADAVSPDEAEACWDCLTGDCRFGWVHDGASWCIEENPGCIIGGTCIGE